MKELNIKFAGLVLLFAITTAIGMETRKQLKEYMRNFTTSPTDLQRKVNQSILQNCMTFLSQQPINLSSKYWGKIGIYNNNLIVKENNNLISTCDLMTGQLKQTYQDSEPPQIVWAFKNNTELERWDNCKKEHVVTFLQEETDNIRLVIINDNKVAIRLDSGIVNIRDISTGKIITTFNLDRTARYMGLCNDMLLAISSWIIQIGNLKSGDLKTFQTGMIPMDATLCDNKAAIIDQNGKLQIWDVHTGTLLRTIEGFKYNSGDVKLAISNDWIVAMSRQDRKAFPLSPPQGTPDENPLVWIKEDADILQGNLIRRACQTTIDDNTFLIALPKKLGEIEGNETREQMDGRIYFTLPSAVRTYLRNCLKIQAKEIMPLSDAI